MTELATLAVRQDAYTIYGCALPYHRPRKKSADAPAQAYQPGCAAVSIAAQQIELQLEYARYEFLANQRGGLRVYDDVGGVYFEASLPDTPFARGVFEAVRAGTIAKVCCAGRICKTFERPDCVSVTAFDVLTINLLLATSHAHRPETFVVTDRDEFERRKRILDEPIRRWMSGKL